jgi:cell wall assembly regulator SMI1
MPARKAKRATWDACARELSAAWRKRPALKRQLGRAASAARVRRAETKLGRRLPTPLLALYSLHDGTRYAAIDGYYRLLSLDQMVKTKSMLDELAARGDFDAWREGQWWNEAWLPFLEFEGDYCCLDGETGEVVEFLANRPRRARLHASAETWLSTLVALTRLAGDADDLTEVMIGRRAQALRKKLNPGHPRQRTAKAAVERRAPAERASGVRPRGEALVEHQSFRRGAYHWMILRSGAFVRTLFGRAYSGRFANKAFADEAKAKRFVEKSIRDKKRDGYQAVGPMQRDDEDLHGVAELARRHAAKRG